MATEGNQALWDDPQAAGARRCGDNNGARAFQASRFPLG
jgi:hypothetical protein